MKFTIHSLLFLFLAIPSISFAQDIIYMTVESDDSGPITHGAGTIESISIISELNHPNESYVYAMEFTSKHDVDPNTGAILGDAIPCELKVKKLTDQASPLFFKSFVNKDNLQVTMKLWRRNYQSGQPEHYYTMKFTDAKIVSFRQLKQESTSGALETDFEEVSFTYSGIEFIHEVAGPTFNYNY